MAHSSLRLVLTALFALTCAGASAAGREETITNPNPDRTWGSKAGGFFTSGKSVGVVIAISNYIGERAGGYPALPTARHDGDKVVDFLIKDAGFDTVYVLTDDNATKPKIDRLMTDVIPGLVGPRDRLLFYWSGHGDQRLSLDGRRAFGFLPLANSRSKEFSAMVSMQDLERWDRYLEARQALFVLDACLSGLAGVENKAPRDARLEQLSLPAHHLLTAGTANESVISGDRWGGSLFTDSFILGAKGQARGLSGIVSVFSLVDFIQDRVSIEKQVVNWSRGLTPQLHSLQAGDGAFFFTPLSSVRTSPAGESRSNATASTTESKSPDIAGPSDLRTWPARPVKMIIPFAPGGASDVLGRLLAHRMTEILGQPVVVENVPGSGGMAGSKRVADASPDGYDFLIGSIASHALSQTMLYKNPPYDATADFTPVALFAEFPIMLLARKDFPGNNLAEFIGYTKVWPMQFGSSGVGTLSHISCVLLNQALGVNRVAHVPSHGTGPALQDLGDRKIDYLCETLTAAKPLIDSSTAKPIAIMTKERLKVLPNVPTAREQGVPNLEASSWNAIFLPRSASTAIVKKLHDAVSQAMRTPALRERLEALGVVIASEERATPEYLGRFLRSEIQKWAAPVRASGAIAN